MATDLENLTARRSAIYAELAATSSTTATGGVNSQAAGIDFTGYKRALLEELEALNKAIDAAGGYWEEIEQAMP